MRMAFGLVSILVAVGVIVWIMSTFTLPATQQAIAVKKNVTPKVEQMAGQDSAGVRAADTVRLKGVTNSSGRMTGVAVSEITAEGAMERYFGLQKGDTITEIGPLSVKDMDSAAAAKDFLVDAYQKSGTITVLRDNRSVTLPLPASAKGSGAAAAGATLPPAGGPSDQGGAGSGDVNSVQKQLQNIPGVPR
jgi:hypothetical protein